MVLKWTRTKPEPLKYFEQELNLNPNRYLKRFRHPAYETAGYYLPLKKRTPFFAFYYETCANTQQALPVQTVCTGPMNE